SDILVPFSPLLLTQFDAFSKLPQFRSNLFLRVIYFSSLLGLSFASRPLAPSQNVNSLPIFSMFHDNPFLFAKSIRMIKRSNIIYFHQCLSGDGTSILPYKQAFRNNSDARPGTNPNPFWYQHIINQVAHDNSLRLTDGYIIEDMLSVPLIPLE